MFIISLNMMVIKKKVKSRPQGKALSVCENQQRNH